jgi:hypothetical protein
MARPRKSLTADQVVKVRELAASGHSQVEIARAIGVDAKTFRRIVKDDVRAADAFDEGRGEEEGRLVRILHKLAENGQAAGAIFLLKARHNYTDRGDQVPNPGGVTVQIALPGPMQMDDWMKLVERTMVTAATPSPSPAPAPALEGAIERA